jgi:hypothetical protein
MLSTNVSCSPWCLREVVFKRPLSLVAGRKEGGLKAMRYAKFMLAPAAAGAALILSSAQTARADFSGAYAPGNWTLTNTTLSGSAIGNGFVDSSAAPVSITLTGSNEFDVFGDIVTDYTIGVAASGTWSFDWLYTSPDSGQFDEGGYLLNGVFTHLAWNQDAPALGSVNISVSAGDIIGFRVHTFDNGFGPGSIMVSNFVAPVPASGSLALLGLAAVPGRSRRRRC